jgi:hypothetical protein
MKKLILIITISTMMLLAACSRAAPVEENSAGQTTPASLMEGALTLDFDDAASLRIQLAFGTLSLQESGTPVSSEEAKVLLPLWQAILALENNPDTADQEITAVQDQIISSMQKEQLEAIAAMQITNTELTVFYSDQGLIISTPSPDSTTTTTGIGKNSGLTTDEKEATKTAAEALGTPVGTNSGSSGAARKSVLTEAVINFLTSVANQ